MCSYSSTCFATSPADILYTAIKRTVRGGCGFKYIFSAKPTRRGRGRLFVRSFIRSFFRSLVHSFISFIQSFSRRRGGASIPRSLQIAAENWQKIEAGGGGNQDNDRVGAERSGREQGISSRYLYIIHPQKNDSELKNEKTQKKRALPSHIS